MWIDESVDFGASGQNITENTARTTTVHIMTNRLNIRPHQGQSHDPCIQGNPLMWESVDALPKNAHLFSSALSVATHPSKQQLQLSSGCFWAAFIDSSSFFPFAWRIIKISLGVWPLGAGSRWSSCRIISGQHRWSVSQVFAEVSDSVTAVLAQIKDVSWIRHWALLYLQQWNMSPVWVTFYKKWFRGLFFQWTNTLYWHKDMNFTWTWTQLVLKI